MSRAASGRDLARVVAAATGVLVIEMLGVVSQGRALAGAAFVAIACAWLAFAPRLAAEVAPGAA